MRYKHSLFFHDGQEANDAEDFMNREYEDFEDIELFEDKRERYRFEVCFFSSSKVKQSAQTAIRKGTQPDAIAFNGDDI
jgi:hypothetical protein